MEPYCKGYKNFFYIDTNWGYIGNSIWCMFRVDTFWSFLGSKKCRQKETFSSYNTGSIRNYVDLLPSIGIWIFIHFKIIPIVTKPGSTKPVHGVKFLVHITRYFPQKVTLFINCRHFKMFSRTGSKPVYVGVWRIIDFRIG